MNDGHGSAHRLRGPGGSRATLCLALLAAMPGASAFDLDYELGVAVAHSDNIALLENGGPSDTAVGPFARFGLQRRGSAVELQARGQFEHRNYLDDTFPNEWRGELAAQLDWSIVPERLSLVLEDYLSHQPIDLGAGLSPGNVQRVNVLIGGPSFEARFGQATRFRLDLRAADTYAEETQGFDGNRLSAAARLQRELGSTRQASFNVVSMEAEFDEPGQDADYRRTDAYAGYRQELAWGLLELDLGRSWLRPEGGIRRDVDATLARASVTWEPTARSRLQALARYQLADSTQDMIVRQADLAETGFRELVATTLQVNADVYRQRRFQLDYHYRGERMEFRLRPRYRRHVYLEATGDDYEDRSVQLDLGYRATPRLTLSLQAIALEREFLATQREDRDRVYGLEAAYRWTRHLSSQLGVHRYTRDSNVAGSGFDEDMVSLTVTWTR